MISRSVFLLGLGLSVCLLAGCGGRPDAPPVTSEADTLETDPDGSTTATDTDTTNPPQAEAAPPPHPWAENPEEIIAAPLSLVRQHLGDPSFIRQEGTAHLWRYDGDFGRLHVVSQTDSRVTAMRCYDAALAIASPVTCLAPLLATTATETF